MSAPLGHRQTAILDHLCETRASRTATDLADELGEDRVSTYEGLKSLRRRGLVATAGRRPMRWGVTVEGYALWLADHPPRMYVLQCDEACDVVAAHSPAEAWAMTFLDRWGQEVAPTKVEPLMCHDEHVVAPLGLKLAWEHPDIAPILRDHGFTYGEPDCDDHCEGCGLHSFEGWSKAPASWRVCPGCYRCVDCAVQDSETDAADDSVCNDCREPVEAEVTAWLSLLAGVANA